MIATTIPSILMLVLDRDDGPARERWEAVATLDELAEARVLYVERWGVFLVDEPQAPLAFYARSPHNPRGDERVLFCSSSGWFEATDHGEAFDRRGRLARGPAERGLDRFDVRVRGDQIEVNVAVVYLGQSPRDARPDASLGSSCAGSGRIEDPPGFWGPARSA